MGKEFICLPDYPVAETTKGKIRGFKFGSTFTFHGIKYANAARFRMPEPVEAWDGICDALAYGYTAPLMDPGRPDGIVTPHRFWPEGEDCQYLNIWTQSLDRGAKKPVIVWIHGGAYVGGSSVEMVAYDGTALSEFGDMVVVSLNHRLNLLGYFDLSSFGDRYWNSANLGQADIVAALEWVRDNIEAFGGDPDCVTIFGQSGGGGKVHDLMQTPAADGLFHRAIIESGMWPGAGMPHSDPQGWREIAEGMIAELGLDGPGGLETVPYSELVRAYKAVIPAQHEKGNNTGFAPLPNDWFVGNSLDVGLTEHAKTIPVIVGSTFAEFGFGFPIGNKDSLSEAEQMEIVRGKYGEDAEMMVELFRKAYPGKSIVDVAALEYFFREPTIAYLDMRAAAGGADTFSYVFALDSALNGGTPAWHCAEIPFAFHNVDLVPVNNIPGVTEKLEAQVAGAWVNFARTGNPANEYLPDWPPYRTGSEATMVFDRESEARYDFDREIVANVKRLKPMPSPGSNPKAKK